MKHANRILLTTRNRIYITFTSHYTVLLSRPERFYHQCQEEHSQNTVVQRLEVQQLGDLGLDSAAF
jgi:hypothetical protein